jgi:serine/threonine protein kinase
MNYCKIKSLTINPCYGITKFPDNGNYAMVLNYHSDGNLRSYLQKNHLNLTLKDRITIFYYLCDALNAIDEKDLIHCDLHSGNIFSRRWLFYTDLGLWTS